jgi:hypothetical protein
MDHKQTRARGVWRDQAAFEYITNQYSIPASVAEKGIDAIIQWANEAKGLVPLAAIAAGIYAYVESRAKEAQLPKVSIAVGARLSMKSPIWMQIMLEDKDRRSGRVLNSELQVVAGKTKRTIPTTLIKSLVRIDKQQLFFTYMDDTTCVGELISSIQLHVRDGFTSEPRILVVEPKKLLSLEGLPAKGTSFPSNQRDGIIDIVASAIGIESQKAPRSDAAAEPPHRTVVTCPSCSTKLAVPSGKSGHVFCPKCKTGFETTT